MVKIRLTRTGRKHLTKFRLVAADSRSPRDGKFLEILGTYDPHALTDEQKLNFKKERVLHWLSVGAQPSDKVWALLRRVGINKATRREVAQAQAAS